MGNVIEVTDKAGWTKEFSLQKTIAYIGADPRNDIVLDPDRGTGVSPRHLQLITVANGFRLINMGDSEVRLGANAERVGAPRAFLEVTGGDRVQVGGFILSIQSGASAGSLSGPGADGNSKSITLPIRLAQT